MSNFITELLYGVRTWFVQGVEMPTRNIVKFVGNVTAVDNPLDKCTEITLTNGAGVVDLSDLLSTTGLLPTVRQASQSMAGDVVGTTAANAVETITGDTNNELTSLVKITRDDSFPNCPIVTYRETGVAVSGGGALSLFAGAAILVSANKTYTAVLEIDAHDVSGGSASSYSLSQSRYVNGAGVISTLGMDTNVGKISGDATASIVWPGAAGGYITVEGGPVLAGNVVYSATLTVREVGQTP